MNIKKIIREEIESSEWDWVRDVSDKKHLYGVVLLNNDYKLIYINANTIDELWEIYRAQYNKGMDPMLYSIDGRVLKGYSGIEPKADIARKIHEVMGESVKLPIEIGDTVYMGRFKNKKVVIKDISWSEKGDLMINGKSALRLRIPKKKKLQPKK